MSTEQTRYANELLHASDEERQLILGFFKPVMLGYQLRYRTHSTPHVHESWAFLDLEYDNTMYVAPDLIGIAHMLLRNKFRG